MALNFISVLKMLFLILTVIVSAYFFLKMYLHRRRLLKYVQRLPTSNDIPLIGCGHLFIGKSTIGNKDFHILLNFHYFCVSDQGIMEKLIQVCEAVPNPSRRWLGNTLIIIISSPEDMQIVLNSPYCLEKPFLYEFMDPDNNGLFLAKGTLD